MPRTPTPAVRSALGLTKAAAGSKGKRRKELVEGRTPKGGAAANRGKSAKKVPAKRGASSASNQASTTASARAGSKVAKAPARKTSQDARSRGRPAFKTHSVAASTAAKWGPVGKGTLEHVKGILDESLSIVLNSALRANRDTEEQLVELRDEMLAELEETRAPIPPKRRKLGFREMEERNRRDEESLLDTYREIRVLEAEVDEQQRLLDADEDQLNEYEGELDAADDHNTSKLHPVLRKALGDLKSKGGLPPMASDVAVHDWGSAVRGGPALGRCGDGDDALSSGDEEVDTVAQKLCDRLSGAESRMRRFSEWLGATHDVATALQQQASTPS